MRQRPVPPAQAHVALVYARVLTGICFFLGLMGLFQTDLGQHTAPGGAPVLIFRIDLTTSIILLAMALVGLPATHTPPGALRFLVAAGAVLLPWAIAGYFLNGRPSDPFDRNLAMVNTQLGLAIVALVIALWRRWPAIPPTAPPREQQSPPPDR